MKVRVEMRQTIFYSGEIEIPREKYEEYKEMEEEGLINVMVLKGLDKEEDWQIVKFSSLSGEDKNESNSV